MDFATMNKAALRTACKDARISYGGMSNDQMRAALQAHHDAIAAERAADEAAVADRASYLASLGEFGEGESAETAVCPHCGINHFDNGVVSRDDEAANKPGVTLHQEGMVAHWECMGCGGQWGDVVEPYVAPKRTSSKPTGTGLKIEKDRVMRNGIKQPSIGGACRSVWDACAEMQALNPDTPLTVKQVKEHAATMGWNVNNATIEFYRWKKWAAPTAEEQLAAHEAARNAAADEALAATPEPDAGN